jgi:hypothetical protein
MATNSNLQCVLFDNREMEIHKLLTVWQIETPAW